MKVYLWPVILFSHQIKILQKGAKVGRVELRQNTNGFRHQNDRGALAQITRHSVADKELASLFCIKVFTAKIRGLKMPVYDQ